jgi:hypothetical protein
MLVQEFIGPWLGRLYRVDDAGISEFSRDGVPLRLINWPELARLSGSMARSAGGERIRFCLDKVQLHKFLRVVQVEWRTRHPDAWRKNNDYLLRQLHWWFRVILPLISVLPPASLYLMYWWLGCPPQAAPLLQEMNRVSLVAGLLVIVCWLFDFLWLRRYRDGPPYMKKLFPETSQHDCNSECH